MTEAHAPALEPYLSQVRFASAVFAPDGTLAAASPRFVTLFVPEKENSTYTKIFSPSPLLLEKVRQAVAERKPLYLYDVPVFTDSPAALYTVEILPLMNSFDDAPGVAVNLFEARQESVIMEQMRRHDALSRVNLIASGLAHEIKNPLAGVKGAAQLILADLERPERLKEYAGIIVRETERINRLVGELLDFSRPKTLHMTRLNIHQVLHDAVEVQRLAAGDAVTIQEVFDPSLPEIQGDADALRQVFLNLLKNACEACQGTPDPLIQARSEFVTDFVLKTSARRSQFLRLQIRDNGRGMSEEQLKNVFTPYYTTKAGGTGLGLAIVNKLVELHGGSVTLRSQPGQGTTFSVYLPVPGGTP